MNSDKNKFLEQLIKDVDEGLSAPNKYLKSKYFYDATGDLLFSRITHLPEYYLTVCETEILHIDGKEILSTFQPEKELNIVELGSGDGTKTKLLIEAATDMNLEMTYFPVDISKSVLELAKKNIEELVPVVPTVGDYSEVLSEDFFRQLPNKLVLFLGSNIGNFSSTETAEFMNYLNKNLNSGDHVLIGFDLVKDPKIILAAYNDITGLTSDFNMNLLDVLNRELKGDFERDNFFHAPVYDEKEQAAKSYLVSNKKQKVFFESLFKSFSFESGEAIFTEVSSKYTLEDIEKIVKSSGFQTVSIHSDQKKYFANVLMVKN